MASTVKHLRSSTASKRPTASGLAEGQLAINTASGTPGLFLKNSAGTVVKVGPAHVGASAPNAVPAGSAGNSTGELWVNNSSTIHGLNYYTGSAFVNLTPSGTTTVAGLVELATNAETQAGTDTVRAVTPSGLQSKVSDSTSTTSSTTIASSTAVKAAYDLANAALPKAGGTVTGALEIGTAGSLVFEGSSADSFETTLAVVNPTADRTITLPNVTGTVITTGDSGTVTSAMIADLNIVNADINASAAIALSKLATGALPSGITVASANIVDGTIVNADISASAAIADTKLDTISTAGKVSGSAITSGAIETTGSLEITNAGPTIRLTESDGTATHSQTTFARSNDQLLIQTRSSTGALLSNDYLIPADASGATEHEWRIASTKKASLDSTGLTVVDDLIISDKIIHAGDTNTAIRFPAADTVTVETDGSERVRVDSSGRLLVSVNSAIVTTGDAGGSTTPHIQLAGTNSNAVTAGIYSYATSSSVQGELIFSRSKSGTIATHTAVAESDDLGTISFAGSDGDNFVSAASIVVEADGTPGTNDMPGRIIFKTTADGASTPTERLRIKSDGESYFQANNTTSAVTINQIGTGNALVVEDTTNPDATPVVIDSVGRLLAGTTAGRSSRSSTASFQAQLQVETSGSDPGVAISRFIDTGSPSYLCLQKGRGSIASPAAVIAGDLTGRIIFSGWDGSNWSNTALIDSEVDGTPGANDMPGRLVFSTTPDGSAVPTERMRITSAGNVGIGTTDPLSPLHVAGLTRLNTTETAVTNTSSAIARTTAANNTGDVSLESSANNTATRHHISFVNPNGIVGSISTNASATAYNTSSDYRLKENITLLDGAIARLSQLPVHRFNFIADPDTVVDGFIAHEVAAVVPECVTGEKDEVNENGDPVYQGIDQSKVVPLLTAALQEAIAMIGALEARVAALEA